MLSNRCRNILMEILKSRDGIKTNHLAGIFDVSERTIRYDLDEIDYFLKANHLPKLIRKAGFGVQYTQDSQERKRLINKLKEQDASVIVLTPDERLLDILYEYCVAGEYIKLDQQAKRLGVSK